MVAVTGRTSRSLPQVFSDAIEQPERIDRYGGTIVSSIVPTKHLLVDEGSYFTAATLPAATSLQLGLSASFSATATALVIQNTDSPTNAAAKRIFLDYIHLVVVTAPTSSSAWNYATVLDSVNRAPSTIVALGSPATGAAYRMPTQNTNMDLVAPSIAAPYFPASTAGGTPVVVPAAGPNARTIIGGGQIRSTIPIVADDYRFVFGPADFPFNATPAATVSNIQLVHAPVALGPGQSFLLYMWGLGNITAGMAFSNIDMGWWER
jgi:hypothetical protein